MLIKILTALKGVHIKDRRDYIVLRSTLVLFIARYLNIGCPWRIRAAKMYKHKYFEIRKLPTKHNCMWSNPIEDQNQDHQKISSKFIVDAIKGELDDYLIFMSL